MLRHNIIIFSLVIISGVFSGTYAQIVAPVKWSYAAKRIDVTSGQIFVKATIQPGWHIYSHYMAEGGPLPTKIRFTSNPGLAITDKVIEQGKKVTKKDETFAMTVSYYENEVAFIQKVTTINTKKTLTVKGRLEYMACNDHQCLPPETVEFNIPIK